MVHISYWAQCFGFNMRVYTWSVKLSYPMAGFCENNLRVEAPPAGWICCNQSKQIIRKLEIRHNILVFCDRIKQHISLKKLTLSAAECSNWRKYFGFTCIPCVGRGDSEARKGGNLDGCWFTDGENCSCASIFWRTCDGKTVDQVPKRWRIEGCWLGWTCLYASQKT